MKKIIIALLLASAPAYCQGTNSASTTTYNNTVILPTVGAVDLAAVVGSMRASMLVNSHGDVFYGGHLPVATLLGRTSKAEYANFNIGVVYSSDKRQADFMASVGIRLDSVLAKIGTKWPNLKTAKLPPLEVGPFCSYGFNKWMYGGMISLRLGGK